MALARALINRPKVLLLDEPLGALDLKLREEMQAELKGLQQRLGITFVFVTHDQGEALSMADRVAVFSQGRIEQLDTPRELYNRPQTAFVASFVGSANVVGRAAAQSLTGSDRAFAIRPELIDLLAAGEPAADGYVQCAGEIVDVLYHGASSRLRVQGGRAHDAGRGAGRDRWRRCRRPDDGRTRASCLAARTRRPVAGLTMAGRAEFSLQGRQAFYFALLLAPPLLWLGIVYLGSLFTLLLQSFYAIDEFTARIVPEFTLATYRQLLTQPAHIDIIVRTLLMAVAVTLAAAVIAFPVALYMARYAGPRMKALFYVGVMLPMWTSYLVKVYAWRLILAKQGIASWGFEHLGLMGALDKALEVPVVGGPSLASSYIGMFVVFVYMWLPFMILPLAAALERVPASLLQASADLGATARPDVPQRRAAARTARSCRGFHLHVLAHARRLHHSERGRRARLLHRHDGVPAAGHRREPAARGGVLGGADRADRPVPDAGQAAGGVRCALSSRAARRGNALRCSRR